MITRTLTVATTVFAFIAAPAFAQVAIERLAPENTIAFVGARNVKSLKEHLERTSLWSLWQSKQLQDMRAEVVKTMTDDMDKMFQELGIEKDTLVCPEGAVGFALFTTRDPVTDMPTPGFLAVADYGNADNAEKTDKLVQAALARGEKDGEIEFDQKDVAGRNVYTIDLSKLQEKAADEVAVDEDMDLNPMPIPDPAEMMKGLTALHYVRDGNSVMMSSDIKSLTEALEQTDAKATGGLIERPDAKAVLDKVSDYDIYAGLITRDVMDLVASVDPMGMAEMFKPTIRTLVGEVSGYGFGMKLDGSTAMMEQSVFVLMPRGKAGLTRLIDQPAARAAVPAFVGADAVSYTSMAFDMSGLMDVITSVINSNPMLAAQLGPQLDTIAPMVNQMTAAMGKRLHWATLATRPFSIANRQAIMAIECTKPQEFEEFFSGLAAQMGIEGRDFLGQRIYTIDPEMFAMMMPMPIEAEPASIGIGGGFILIGPTPAVEQALRATSGAGGVDGGGAGAAGGATLATSVDYQRAIGALSNEPVVAWGYTDTIDSMESSLAVQRETMENTIREMKADAEEFAKENGEDGAAAEIEAWNAEMEADLRESMKMWDMIDFTLLRKHIGPGAWQVSSTDDGFVMRAFLLGASGE